jgi:hypothetical protein
MLFIDATLGWIMRRLDLGRGVVAFENEGEADGVGSVRASELTERRWPPELVENIRRYQERLIRSSETPHAEMIQNLSTSDDE